MKKFDLEVLIEGNTNPQRFAGIMKSMLDKALGVEAHQVSATSMAPNDVKRGRAIFMVRVEGPEQTKLSDVILAASQIEPFKILQAKEQPKTPERAGLLSRE